MMRKIYIITAIALLLFSNNYVGAQVPADSLPGTYVGIFKQKKSTDISWTINVDTLRVYSIDSAACQITSMHATYGWGPTVPFTFYTAYTYCNGNPVNYYYKFYGGDSIRFIANNIPQPPPITYSISYQFYGKRIGKIITGINTMAENKLVNIYPNPCNNRFVVECEILNEEMQIIITNAMGNEVKKQKAKNKIGLIEVDVSNFKKGIYFLFIKTSKAIMTKKIIIN